MKNLIEIQKKDGLFVVSSRQVARDFGKNHKHVLDSIDLLVTGVAEKSAGLFIPSEYVHEQNKQKYREYLLTRDGFSLLVMGFSGAKSLEWKLKYIEAFNKMEERLVIKPLSKKEELKLYLETLEEQDAKIESVNEDLQQFKKDMPLLALELQRITRAKNRKVVPLMGGKNSNAYKDNSLRTRVYRDLESQINRQFGVDTYKAIKRSQTDLAVSIIENYTLPFTLAEEIKDTNAQMSITGS